MKNKQDQFEVLRKIQKTPDASQRELAEELGFSLGKLNYCLKSLQKKRLVKLQNFQKKTNKMSYLQYVITPRGITYRTKLTINFMKRKMKNEFPSNMLLNYPPDSTLFWPFPSQKNSNKTSQTHTSRIEIATYHRMTMFSWACASFIRLS